MASDTWCSMNSYTIVTLPLPILPPIVVYCYCHGGLRFFLKITYKLLNTTQPTYLYDLIALHPSAAFTHHPCWTMQEAAQLWRTTDSCFRYASPRVWNQFPYLFCQLLLIALPDL